MKDLRRGERLWNWALLALTLLVFGLYGLRAGWLNYDDPRLVLDNPAFRAGAWEGLSWIWDPSRTLADVYLPISNTSLWIDWQLFGPERAWGFHAHSIVLHAINAVLLAGLLCELGVRRLIAVTASLVFALHPALVESVVWVSSRKDVVSGLFVLLTLRLGLRATRIEAETRSARRNAVLALLCALLAVYAKQTALVLPLLAILTWRSRDGSRSLRLVGVLALVCVLAGLHHSWIAAEAGTSGYRGWLATVPGAFLFYVRQAIWPLELAVHHPRELLDGFANGAELKALWLGILALAGLVIAVRTRPPLRLVGFGVLVLLGALAPFNGFKPAFGVAAADRYLYLPLIGLAFVAAGLAACIPRRVEGPAVAALAVALVATLGYASVKRSEDFTSSQRLWATNLRVYPNDVVGLVNAAEDKFTRNRIKDGRELLRRARGRAARPELRLRVAMQQFRGELLAGSEANALPHIERAIAIADELPSRQRGLRVGLRLQAVDLCERLGHGERAAKRVDSILALDAENPIALGRKASLELAKAFARVKKLPIPEDAPELVEARELLARVDSKAQPVDAIVARSELHRLTGETTRAASVLASYRGPVEERVALQAARIYGSEGLLPEAIGELERGLRAARVSLRLPLRLAELYMLAGRLGEAEVLLRKVLADQPSNASVQRAYAKALVARARSFVGQRPVSEYRGRVRRAKELAPDLPELPYLEAIVLEGEGKPRQALTRARHALALQADDERVKDLLLRMLKRCGFLELVQKRPENAYRLFRELLDRAPKDYELRAVIEVMRNEFMERFDKATKALLEKDYAGAQRLYERALVLFPDHDDALLKLGMALFADARFNAADAKLAESIRLATARGADPGMAIWYRMRTLQALERPLEAGRLAKSYLDTDASKQDAEIRARIETLAKSLGH